ncbi:hypothetical protein F5Y18DRAFT_423617 [Xylariaceae sp. FL1019]|nr:hypothetical protein F5Y18DRAFT_423617 [Xylariaceae sp. FL1019]
MNIIVSVLAMASLIAGAALDVAPRGTIYDSLPENYTMGEVTWTLPLVEGGQTYTFYGDIQSVVAQVNIERAKLGIAPLRVLSILLSEWKEPAKAENPVHMQITKQHVNRFVYARDNNPTASPASSVANKRTFTETKCKTGLSDEANQNRIKEGIGYLQDLKDAKCGMNGPNQCGRISCSWGAAIVWCNENDHWVEYDCSSFADYAIYVVRNCSFLSDRYWNQAVWGTAYDSDNFNVQVGYSKC